MVEELQVFGQAKKDQVTELCTELEVGWLPGLGLGDEVAIKERPLAACGSVTQSNGRACTC